MTERAIAIRQPPPWVIALFAVGLCNLLLGVKIAFSGDLFDFGVFYMSACGWWHGTNPYSVPNLNPPHASVLTAPLCAMGRYHAWFAWQFLNAVAWCAALALASRTRLEPVTVTAVAVLVAHGSTSAQVQMGQVAWILALPVTLSWLQFRRGSFRGAGIWLGLVLAIKPFLVLAAVPGLVDRRWRMTWLTAGLTALCISAFGYLVLGGDVYRRWSAWSEPALTLASQSMNVGLTSVAWRLGIYPGVGIAVGVAGWLVVLPRWRVMPADLQWLVTLTMLVLSAPLGWLHYTAWLLPVLWPSWPKLAPGLRVWALGLLCVPTLSLVPDVTALRLVYPAGLLLLICAALQSVRLERQ